MGFKKVFLSLLLLASTSLHADSNGWEHEHKHSRGDDPWERERDGSANQNPKKVLTVEENIQNYFDERNSLDLLGDPRTFSLLQGRRIKDITVVASTENGRGRATLSLDGKSIEDAKEIPRQMSSATFRVDPFENVVGQSLRTIVLNMRGHFYVEKVVFNLFENVRSNDTGPTRPPERSQVEVVRQQVNQRIQQEGGLDLFRLFNLSSEREGQIVKRVTLVARSIRRASQASLVLNNQSVSVAQNIGFESSRITFELSQGMKIGKAVAALRLFFRGDILVEEVSLEIEKCRDEGRGQHTRKHEQVVNLRLYDTDGIDLKSLLQTPQSFDERTVDSVELVTRYSDRGVRLKLCQVIQDRYQSINCSAPVMIKPGFQIFKLEGLNRAKLRELQLSVKMGMVDIESIIINFND